MRKFLVIILLFCALVVYSGCGENKKSNCPIAGCTATVTSSENMGTYKADIEEMGVKPGMTVTIIDFKDSDSGPTVKVKELNKQLVLPEFVLDFDISVVDRIIPAMMRNEYWARSVFNTFHRNNHYFSAEESVKILNDMISYSEEKLSLDFKKNDSDFECFNRAFYILDNDTKQENDKTSIWHVLAEKTGYAVLEENNAGSRNNLLDENGRTPFMRAIIAENFDSARYFYENRKDFDNYDFSLMENLNHKDSSGKSTIDYAKESKNTDIKNLLAAMGINFDELGEKYASLIMERREKEAENAEESETDSKVATADMLENPEIVYQDNFKAEDFAIVVAEDNVLCDDGSSYTIEPEDKVEILYEINHKSGRNLYEFYENSLYPYYIVRKSGFESGLISGKSLAHEQLNTHYSENNVEHKFYVSYKKDLESLYGDIYEYDGSSMRKYKFVEPAGLGVRPQNFKLGPKAENRPDIELDKFTSTYVTTIESENGPVEDKFNMITFRMTARKGYASEDGYEYEERYSYVCLNENFAIISLSVESENYLWYSGLGAASSYNVTDCDFDWDSAEENITPMAVVRKYTAYYDGDGDYADKVTACHKTYYKLDGYEFFEDHSEDTDELYER